jgi:hypothetical protein
VGVDLELRDAQTGEVVRVPPFREGGMLRAQVNPAGDLEPIDSHEAEISITYNYSAVLKLVVPDYQGLVALFDERVASEVALTLEMIVERCGTQRYEDYWAATPGNVGAIMAVILEWCRLHPDAVFSASG